jgi:hypothetical protein
MPNFIPGFESPEAPSPETMYVRSLKEKWANREDFRPEHGTRMVNFNVDATTRRRFTEALRSHGMSLTEVLTMVIEDLVPLFEKARPVTVDGYRPATRGYRRKKSGFTRRSKNKGFSISYLHFHARP